MSDFSDFKIRQIRRLQRLIVEIFRDDISGVAIIYRNTAGAVPTIESFVDEMGGPNTSSSISAEECDRVGFHRYIVDQER